MRRLLLPIVVLLAGCAATPEQQSRIAADQARDEAAIAKTLAGLVPGAPRDCMPRRDGVNTETHGNTILYKTGRNLIYRTDTNGGCFGLKNGDIIVTVSQSSDLCRGDIVRTVSSASRTQTGSCSFGMFTPYTRPKE